MPKHVPLKFRPFPAQYFMHSPRDRFSGTAASTQVDETARAKKEANLAAALSLSRKKRNDCMTLLLKLQRPSSDDAGYRRFEIRQSFFGRVHLNGPELARSFNPDVFYNVSILIWNNLTGVYDQRMLYRKLSIAFVMPKEVLQELKVDKDAKMQNPIAAA
ncbi:hypothetical protein PILCRDRAFT_9650 [Piloderma croceum F 1598]|uniref:Uncharacterized protein n=1 Tax=Piloderma croceum (strain F 1598) TaxID=765440 RepID=A0A0C3FLR2_PILCF|nr:hypothetical protein PILCRDRAFT_9650 [Piloderma croceum F 1598]